MFDDKLQEDVHKKFNLNHLNSQIKLYIPIPINSHKF